MSKRTRAQRNSHVIKHGPRTGQHKKKFASRAEAYCWLRERHPNDPWASAYQCLYPPCLQWHVTMGRRPVWWRRPWTRLRLSLQRRLY